ncbi:MAG: DUF5067 domain-containing protein [Ruminococcus flavefaciens]|nr:DUF5067 domain-containing protein [Ruminococcus flavefaciens]MCM1229107.1 DUF5067 domain-containing protein [Ruminococcus flavefaciens]
MKKHFALCIAVFMAGSLASCSSANTDSLSESISASDIDSSSEISEESAEQSETSEKEEQTEPTESSSEAEKSEESGISIASWSLDKDYSGKDALVVEYAWTNDGDEPESFMLALNDKVFQNGIECETAIGCESVDSSMQSRDVQPGVTYNIKVAYVLQDMTTANIVVTKAFSFDDTPVLDEKIDLGGGDGNVVSDDDLQETSVKIADYSFDVDYSGADILVVDYEFYNGEKKAKSFATTFTDKAFQNGIECDSFVVMGMDSEIDLNKSLNDVQPGVTCIVTKAYKLNDESDIEISVTGWISDDEYLKETIKQ